MSDSHSPQPSSNANSPPGEHSQPTTPIQESRSVLSPVSPKPVHFSEPSDIPVLKNQTDPHFNSAEAHPYLAMSNGADTAMSQSPLSQETLHQPPQPAAMSDATTNLLDALTKGSALPTTQASSGETSTANGAMSNGAGSDAGSRPASTATVPTLSSATLPSNVDLQALLTKLSPTTPHSQQFPSVPQTPAVQSSGIAPVLQMPASHAPGTDMAHPSNSTHIPAAPGTIPPQPAASSLPPPPSIPSSLPAHPHSAYPSSLPPPPNQDSVLKPTEQPTEEEEDRPFTVEEEEEFSRFLADERDYVSQGQWDRFPSGSRLFIGNLPTEKVTKRDVFRVFRKHGRLAQVSIKQAYGFVQFLDTQSCSAALRAEQGASIRGRKMHLEVSKPQRNTRDRTATTETARRRSRSPEFTRNRSPPRRGNNRGSRDERGVDRYRSGPGSRESLERDREDYRARNRSPPARYGQRDDYRPGRRSRSRSPPSRYRGRSPTPDHDDVPLPRRAPSQVPEVQILVSDELDRNFIWWVENAFRQRGLTADMLFLSPRLQLSAVVKRQIIEGVMAVVFLNHQSQQSNRITIQIFDRRGEGEATYDQYDNLDPPVAAELVVRSKQAHAPAVTATYGYGAPPMPGPPLAAGNPMANLPAAALQQLAAIPNIAQLLSSMDPNTLQKFISGLQGQPPAQPTYGVQPPVTPQQDLASLLSRAQQQTPQPHQQVPGQYGQPQQQHNRQGQGALAAYGGTSGLAALLGQASQKVQQQQAQQQAQQQQAQQHQTPGQGAGQLPNIMETLAKWKQS